jgi:hypothetical protein
MNLLIAQNRVNALGLGGGGGDGGGYGRRGWGRGGGRLTAGRNNLGNGQPDFSSSGGFRGLINWRI